MRNDHLIGTGRDSVGEGGHARNVRSRIRRMFRPSLRRPEENEISKQFIGRYLPSPAVIVEAGAHVGVDTEEMATLWPGATIHAFEPVPYLFSQLQSRSRSFANVRTYRLALHNRTGHTAMFLSSGASDGSSSLLPPKQHLSEHPDVTFESEINVETSTLDDWASLYDVERVDMLWLDMQGSELEVMMASERVMRQIRVIHTEVSLKETYAGVPLYPELRAWLELRGFQLVKEYLPWEDMGNALFVRTSSFDLGH